MLFVVIYHVRMHSGFASRAYGSVEIILDIITNIIVVHVNSFVLLCGYFQSKSKFKFSKVISINNSTWFYKSLFMIVALFLIKYTTFPIEGDFEKITVLKTFSWLDHGIYWYIDCYLVLYLISPLLNKIIDNSSKKELQRIILLLFLLFSIIPIITLEETIYTRNGHSVTSFILLYFVGAYLRIYPIKENYYFKKMSNTLRKTIFIIIILVSSISLVACRLISMNISTYGVVMNHIAQILNTNYLSFGGPILIIESIAYFLLFESINLKSKFVNKVAKYSLGVYLIHENVLVRENLYQWLKFTIIEKITLKTIGLMIGLSILIYIISTIIEMIRQGIFKYIYNRKISSKIRTNCKNYIEKIGIHVNW